MAPQLRNIALSGRSGAGKSTVARRLVTAHGYTERRSGALCRRVCLDLFNDESKEMLNAVTDAMRSIQPDVWIEAALRGLSDEELIVFDSMRFAGDYERLRAAGFVLWRVETPREIRVARLSNRGQAFRPELDDLATPEVELDGHEFDYVIDNGARDIEGLWRLVDAGIETVQHAARVSPARSANR